MFTYNKKTERNMTTKTTDLQWEIQAYGIQGDEPANVLQIELALHG
jgi:hypothetical protein